MKISKLLKELNIKYEEMGDVEVEISTVQFQGHKDYVVEACITDNAQIDKKDFVSLTKEEGGQ